MSTVMDQIRAKAALFKEAVPLLEQALASDIASTWTLDAIFEKYMADMVQLWRGERYAAITEIIDYPARRLVLVHLAAGELDAVINAFEDLEEFARIVGASGIEIHGRKGWAKVLRGKGFQEASVRLFKEV